VFNQGGMVEKISYEPLGVIANISAWNYPYFVGLNVIIPALLTGNSVLYKPSEYATLSGLEIAKLLHESGIPRNSFVPVIGNGSTGTELIRTRINGIFFTGSYKTGQAIANAVFENKLIDKIQLELGGKDPVYIHSDVDLAKAAAITADGAFYNNGQSCCSVERIYVHESVYDKFIELFVKEVNQFKVGDPMNPETYIGPLARKQQLKLLLKQIEDAKAQGGRVLVGGNKIDMNNDQVAYLQPTVIVNATHGMLLMNEESFGPIIGIQKVSTIEEAIKLMNDTEYGLTAGVFSKDEKVAKEILSKVKTGTSYWNCCDRVSPRLPWSGRQNSGIGQTLGIDGLKTFVQPKSWHWKNN